MWSHAGICLRVQLSRPPRLGAIAVSPPQAFVATKEKLIKAEWHLLDALEYDVAVDNPAVYVRPILAQLGLADNVELSTAVQQVVGDTCRTQVCIQHPAKDIACAAVFFGTFKSKTKLPEVWAGWGWKVDTFRMILKPLVWNEAAGIAVGTVCMHVEPSNVVD